MKKEFTPAIESAPAEHAVHDTPIQVLQNDINVQKLFS
jgi:hypothetical protein